MTWLDEVAKHYGEPRVKAAKAIRAEDEFGLHDRQSWVWFPDATNHHISIGHYKPTASRTREFWVLRVGSHKKRSPQVMLKLAHKPTDVDVMECLDICMFFDPEDEVQKFLKSDSVLSMTIQIS